jgi:hypothetical protein
MTGCCVFPTLRDPEKEAEAALGGAASSILDRELCEANRRLGAQELIAPPR